jgi:hypothetical protein
VSELAVKRERLLGLLDNAGFEGVLLTLPGNVAWYAGGGRSHVITDTSFAIAQVLVHRDGDVVFTNEIEAQRLADEELGGLGAEFRVRPWWLPGETPKDFATDAGEAATILRRARERLTAEEIERYRSLGADAAAVLTDVLLAATSQTTEYALTGAMTGGLMDRGIEAMAFFAGGERRAPVYRHPLPTMTPIGERALLVAGARRAGLIACLSRLVAFSPLSDAERERYGELLEVEAAFLDATQPGRSLGAVFAAGTAAYATHGFEADEWHRHHQGGPAGYFARDEIVTPASTDVVVERQAFAWNPSAPAIKVEDTYVTSAEGIDEIFTVDLRWPTIDVAGRKRPAILEL